MDWSQEKRPFRLYTPLGSDVLLLNSWHGTEQISRFFKFTVDAISKRNDISAKELLLKEVHLALRLPDGTDRKIYGVVSRLSQGGSAPQGYVAYELEIMPMHWLASLDTGFDIFQNQGVIDIARKLLSGAPCKWQVMRTYDPRPYCFRYRESKWNMAARLFEQEGIWFRFDHTGGQGEMVICDSAASAQPAWGVTKLQYNEYEFDAPRLSSLRLDSSPFVVKTKVRTASEFLPTQNVGETTPSSGEFKAPSGIAAYLFEQQMTEHRTGINHSGGMTPADIAKLQPDTKVYSRLRQELAETMSVRYAGESRYVGLEAGAKTDITGHANDDMNGSVFITSVTHSGSNGSYDGGDDAIFKYDNIFEAIPAGVAYRPERITPWPHVGGSHTGVVVGPPGEEIYTDKHGRVQVVFKWDEFNSTSLEYSCWIRVAQSFAGNSYGMVFLPRVGHEVMVEFLDGNPDNPIVVGSLYNAQNLPPWPLPENKTQTGVRTRSTLKGGPDNHNELRFEDKIKEEQIWVQAEKNLDTLVKNDETRLVQHDRTTTIHNNEEKTVDEGWEKTTVTKGEQFITVADNNRWLHVEKDNNITVNGNEYVKVTKNREITVSASQIHTITEDNTFTIDGKQAYTVKGEDKKTVTEGNSSLEVSEGDMGVAVKLGDISIKAAAGGITIEAMKQIELKVGANSIVIDMKGITIKGAMVQIEGTALATIKSPLTQVKGDGLVIIKGGVTMIN